VTGEKDTNIIKAADRKVIEGHIEETLDFRRLHKFKVCWEKC